MDTQGEGQGYGSAAKALHWLGALCVLVAWVLGTTGDDFPKAMRPGVLFVHMSVGLAVIGLLVVRLGWRMGNPPPAPLHSPLGDWGNYLATAAHWSLYLLMVMIPVSGIMLEFARGQPLPFFGLFEIASPWTRNPPFARLVKEVHELLANLILILAVLHAGAALIHHYVLRDGTLLRMLPGPRRR